MKCSNCGEEITQVLVDTFEHDGTDRDYLVDLEDIGNDCYGITVSQNWTGYGLDEEDQLETIACPKCHGFPFKTKEIDVQEVVCLTFWND